MKIAQWIEQIPQPDVDTQTGARVILSMLGFITLIAVCIAFPAVGNVVLAGCSIAALVGLLWAAFWKATPGDPDDYLD